MNLEGKVAVVTGGSGCLGKCFVETLLKKNIKVCFCDINATEGEAIQKEFGNKYGKENVLFKQCDVRKESDIKDVLDAAKKVFNKIDIMINNAAIVNENDWEKMLDVNLGGYIRGTVLALEYMRKDKGGNGGIIINVSSVSGFAPTLTIPVYTASKHGVIGYSRTMAMRPEVIENWVRVTCLCPAAIDTPLGKKAMDVMPEREREIHQRFIDAIGSLSVERVAEGVIKLLTDSDNNGGVLYVDCEHGIGYKIDDHPVSVRFTKPQCL